MSEGKTALDRFVHLNHEQGRLAGNEYLDAIPADAPAQIATLTAERNSARDGAVGLEMALVKLQAYGVLRWPPRIYEIGDRALIAYRERKELTSARLQDVRP